MGEKEELLSLQCALRPSLPLTVLLTMCNECLLCSAAVCRCRYLLDGFMVTSQPEEAAACRVSGVINSVSDGWLPAIARPLLCSRHGPCPGGTFFPYQSLALMASDSSESRLLGTVPPFISE